MFTWLGTRILNAFNEIEKKKKFNQMNITKIKKYLKKIVWRIRFTKILFQFFIYLSMF